MAFPPIRSAVAGEATAPILGSGQRRGDGSVRHLPPMAGVGCKSVLREVQSPDAGDIGRQWEREMAVRVMTAYVAHELNHPLGTIINLVNILSRRLADPVVRPKDIGEHVQNIKA